MSGSDAAADPTGWFEPLYAAAERGETVVPWDRGAPNPLLVEWTRGHDLDPAGRQGHDLDPAGRRALVVGSGLGDDAEHVSALGFATVAFDISPTAVRGAQRRFPDSRVDYVVADLLDASPGWERAFDLVVENITVQALPASVRPRAIAAISGMVAPGGTLLVISGARDADDDVDGPPWPLTRAEVESFATGGVEAVRIEETPRPFGPWAKSWRAEFRRPPA